MKKIFLALSFLISSMTFICSAMEQQQAAGAQGEAAKPAYKSAFTVGAQAGLLPVIGLGICFYLAYMSRKANRPIGEAALAVTGGLTSHLGEYISYKTVQAVLNVVDLKTLFVLGLIAAGVYYVFPGSEGQPARARA